MNEKREIEKPEFSQAEKAQKALSHDPSVFERRSGKPNQDSSYYEDIIARTGDLAMKAGAKIEPGKKKQ